MFGARSAAGSIVTALNIAYEEKEKRSFIMVNLLALGIAAAGVVVAILAVVAIAALGHLESLLPTASVVVIVLGKLLSNVALALAGATGAATLYRYGPSRTKPRYVWLTPGSILAALLWLALTLGFGVYVANFGNYNATYGSLGAVVVLLTWLYLSSHILLFGAELNSELEHQTSEDTTGGTDEPLGDGGAWAADHVAAAAAPDDGSSGSPLRSMSTAAERAASQPSPVGEYVMARAGSRLGLAVGAKRAGFFSSGIAVLGLGFVRRRGTATEGLALLAVAAGLSWLQRGVSKEPGDE